MGNASSEKLPSWVESVHVDQKHNFGPFPAKKNSHSDSNNDSDSNSDSNIRWQHEGTFLGLRHHGTAFALICPNILDNKVPTDATYNAMQICPSYLSHHLVRTTISNVEGLMESPDVLPEIKQLHGHSFRLLQNHTTKRQIILLFDRIQSWILLSREDQFIPPSEAKSIHDLNKKKTWTRVVVHNSQQDVQVSLSLESLHHYHWALFSSALMIPNRGKICVLDTGELQYVSRNSYKWFIVAKSNSYSFPHDGYLKTVSALYPEKDGIAWSHCTLERVLDSHVITCIDPQLLGNRFTIISFLNVRGVRVMGLILYFGTESRPLGELLQAIDSHCYMFLPSIQEGQTVIELFRWNGRCLLSKKPQAAEELAPLPLECQL